MNQSEMKARAQALVNRINAMGFTKNGKPMVIDQAYELVAAQEGFRNQHVLRAAMSKADTSLAKSKEQEAQIAWENLIAHQAWTEQTRLELALSFLAENALFANFLSYAQARALAEGEPDDEVSPELQEVLELMGYEVLTSDLGLPYWECSHPDSDFHGMCSEDFASEELAWADIWRHVQADVPGAGFAAQQAREGNTEPLERWMRCKRAEYAESAKEDLQDQLEQIIEGISDKVQDKGYSVTQTDAGLWQWVDTKGVSSKPFASRTAAWFDLIASICVAADIDPVELKAKPVQMQIDLIVDATKATEMERYTQALQKRWGAEHDFYQKSDWQEDVRRGDTKLGYWEWVAHAIESNGGEEEHCSCGAPIDLDGYDGKCASCADHAFNEEDELLETKEPEESNPVFVDLSSYAAYSFSLSAMSLEALMAESSRWVGVTQINLEQPRSALQAQMLEAFETWRRRCADEAFESFEFGAPVADFSGWESNSGTNELSRIVFLQDKGEEADSTRYRFRVFLDENGVMECESFRID